MLFVPQQGNVTCILPGKLCGECHIVCCALSCVGSLMVPRIRVMGRELTATVKVLLSGEVEADRLAIIPGGGSHVLLDILRVLRSVWSGIWTGWKKVNFINWAPSPTFNGSLETQASTTGKLGHIVVICVFPIFNSIRKTGSSESCWTLNADADIVLLMHPVSYTAGIFMLPVVWGVRVCIALSRRLTATAIFDGTPDEVSPSVLSVHTSGTSWTDVHTARAGAAGGVEVGVGVVAVTLGVMVAVALMERGAGQGVVWWSIAVLLAHGTTVSVQGGVLVQGWECVCTLVGSGGWVVAIEEVNGQCIWYRKRIMMCTECRRNALLHRNFMQYTPYFNNIKIPSMCFSKTLSGLGQANLWLTA